MRLLDFLFGPRGKDTATAAKNRLKVVIAQEKTGGGVPDFLPLLHHEIIQVIRKYVEVDQNKVSIDFERGEGVSMLEVNVELPAVLPRQHFA